MSGSGWLLSKTAASGTASNLIYKLVAVVDDRPSEALELLLPPLPGQL